MKKNAKRMQRGNSFRNSVYEESIASIVSRWTGIPVNKMMDSEKNKKILETGQEVLKKM